MERHETPIALANALSEYAPKELKRILDPSVGNGILLEPFLRRETGGLAVTAVDIDALPLRTLSARLGIRRGCVLRVVHADFLEWADNIGRDGFDSFDCVVMNPPFASRRRDWKGTGGESAVESFRCQLPAKAPIEANFLVRAITLLRAGGRILAVLPASAITARGFGWVRDILCTTGAVLNVHELPRYTFPGVESRIYLLVYEKASKQGKMLLMNHDLLRPESMSLDGNLVKRAGRWDFAFHSASAQYRELRTVKSLDWRPLKDLSVVWRGKVETPPHGSRVIHTTNFVDGFWRSEICGVPSLRSSDPHRLLPGDILIQRVGRSCSRAVGLGVGVDGFDLSDCVFGIRPVRGISTARVLVGLRVLMALPFAPALLERGTGASYIVKEELERLEIPYGLTSGTQRSLSRYSRALKTQSYLGMQKIEGELASRCGVHRSRS